MQLAEKRGMGEKQARVGPKNRDRGLLTFHNGLPEGVLQGSER
jgi:hypothetical protein